MRQLNRPNKQATMARLATPFGATPFGAAVFGATWPKAARRAPMPGAGYWPAQKLAQCTMSRLVAALAAFVLVVAVPAAHAWHRQHVAVTQIAWSPTTRMLEVVHELHAHDVEAMLIALGAPGNISLEDPQVQARAALYVAERFTLSQQDNTPIALDIVGAEFSGHDLYIYQEAPMASAPDGVCVRNTLLFDMWSDQANTVTFDRDRSRAGKIASLVFKAQDPPMTRCAS